MTRRALTTLAQRHRANLDDGYALRDLLALAHEFDRAGEREAAKRTLDEAVVCAERAGYERPPFARTGDWWASVPEKLRARASAVVLSETDLVEWELQGDPVAVAFGVLCDRELPTYIRRYALSVAAFALTRLDPASGAVRAELAHRLTRLQLYSVLAPLETMFANSADSAVRRRVVGCTLDLWFARAWVLIEQGLMDPAPDVRDEAVRALQSNRSIVALGERVRYFETSRDPRVRSAALHSIGLVASRHAVQYLLSVAANGSEPHRARAEEYLVNHEWTHTGTQLRAAMRKGGPEGEVAKRVLARRRRA